MALRVRNQWTLAGALDVARQDFSSAWRSVTHAKGLTAMIALALALGVGANAVMFTLLDRLYLRAPAGIAKPATLRRWWVQHFNTADHQPFFSQALSYPMYRAIARASGDSASVAVFLSDEFTLGSRPGSPNVSGVYASANYFTVLGVRATAGRVYGADEDRLGSGAAVMVVSHVFARDRLGGTTAAIGKSVTIGRVAYTVIGVLGPAFRGLDLDAADVWIPLAAIPTPPWMQGPWWESPNLYAFRAVERQRPGTNRQAADARATLFLRTTNRSFRGPVPDTLMTVTTGGIIETQGPGKPSQEMVISTRLGGVAAIVMIIACANVMNLLLARALRRRREIAVRLALGISRSRLVRLLTLESLLVAAIAATIAVAAAAWGGAMLRSLLLPYVAWAEPAVDGRVALFTVAVALLAGLVAGLVPAIQASRPDLTSALKAGGQGGLLHGARLRGALVGIQAALSVLLLVGAALFVRSLRNVQALDIGYDAGRLLFAGERFAEGESPNDARVSLLMRDIEQRLAGRPGIEVVARAGMEPMRGWTTMRFFSGADSDGSLRERAPTTSVVSPSFFRATGIRLVRGSGFTRGDVDGAPAELVVNQAAAAVLWPGRAAIGQCVRFVKRENPCYTVVGIVENVRREHVIENQGAAQFYLPLGNVPMPGWTGHTLIVRTSSDGAAAAGAEVRAALRAAFPAGEPVITPMTKNLEPEYRPWRLGATLFSAIGLLALAVSLVGIYSTVSYTVSQRTHEFGVRIALGARTADVLRHVFARGLRAVAIGVGLGIALSLAAGRLVAALLYNVEPGDPVVLLLVSVTLLAAAALAALAPAWRAAGVDPVTALRAD